MNTEALSKVAQRTADHLVALHGRLERGEVTREEFVTVALAFLDAARARAVALADLALAAELSVLRRRIVNPLGLAPPDPLPETDVTETLESPQYALDAAAAVAVLGRASTLSAAQEATQEGMRAHDVEYWTRVVEAGACEACRDLEAGRMPVSAEPWFHRGCGCSTRPVEETA